MLRRTLADHAPEKQLRIVNDIVAEIGTDADRVIHPAARSARRAPRTWPKPSLRQPPKRDRVDLLCAFIKWHGLRTLERQLSQVAERGVPFRVITTTYMGATERRAIDRLVRDFGADVRISYEVARTRLHAKAWLFRRASGFDTAYVGSSNLSKVALLDGVEWTVRLSSVPRR